MALLSERLLQRPDLDDAVRDSAWDVRHLFNGGGQVGGFDDGESSDWQGGRHEWSITSLSAGCVWVAYLYRGAGDPHQRTFRAKMLVAIPSSEWLRMSRNARRRQT